MQDITARPSCLRDVPPDALGVIDEGHVHSRRSPSLTRRVVMGGRFASSPLHRCARPPPPFRLPLAWLCEPPRPLRLISKTSPFSELESDITFRKSFTFGRLVLQILLTAFEPYDVWEQNSSWEALVGLLELRGAIPGITTRRYPVDLHQLQERLFRDLEKGFDAVIHLGQAPGASRIHLEAIALNAAGMTEAAGDFFGPIVADGPIAFRTDFPLDLWERELRTNGIPCAVSFHAGTYLCNAIMYLSHLWFYHHQLRRPVGFMHIPLTPEQVLRSYRDLPSMPRSQAAEAVGRVLDLILSHDIELQFA